MRAIKYRNVAYPDPRSFADRSLTRATRCRKLGGRLRKGGLPRWISHDLTYFYVNIVK